MEQLIIERTTSETLHDITGRIFANSALITSNGLQGKMGTAVFLYYYANCYKNAACTQLADSIIKDVLNNISKHAPIDHSTDLPGIEAGLKYLLKQSLIDATMAEMPEIAQQAVYESLLNLPRTNIHECFHRLTALGKYFTQDHRKTSLMATGPFSDFNRRCVLHFVILFRSLDIKMIPLMDHKDILWGIDILSRVYSAGYMVKEMQEFIKEGLKGLEFMLFDKARFMPFTTSCNPFNIALTLLSIYHRTHNPDFVNLAIQVVEEYEGAINKLYVVKDIRNAELLQHVIACKKLHAVLKAESFNNYAEDFLNFYKERKNSGNKDQNDFSLNSGYAGEGMALLTLEGHIQSDWLEDLIGY